MRIIWITHNLLAWLQFTFLITCTGWPSVVLPYCQNPNTTTTQPQTNITLVGLDRKMTLHTTPPTETQCYHYLSCYWPDFDETFKVGSCEHLEHISTVRVTFVHVTFVLPTFVHIRNISAVTDPILMKLYS